MKRILALLVGALATSAHAQVAWNPATLFNPYAGGLGAYGGYGAVPGNPLGALANPLLANPQLGLAALGALGTVAPLLAPAVAPGLMSPNLMSYQYMN